MNYSFQLSNLGRADRKAFYLLFAPPERPRRAPSLIPAGDRYSSRGQRPRKTRPPQGATLKGSNSGDATPVLRSPAQGNTTPSGSGNEHRAFRGRCPRLLSCALAGHEKPTLRIYSAAPVSDITDSRFRLCAQNDSMADECTDVRLSSAIEPFECHGLTRRGPGEPAVPWGGQSRWRGTAFALCAQQPATNCRDAFPAKRAQRDSAHLQRLEPTFRERVVGGFLPHAGRE